MGAQAKIIQRAGSVGRVEYLPTESLNRFFEPQPVSLAEYAIRYVRLWVLAIIATCGLIAFLTFVFGANRYLGSLWIFLSLSAAVSEVMRFKKTFSTPEWAHAFRETLVTYNGLATGWNISVGYATEEAIATKTVETLVEKYWAFSHARHHLQQLLHQVDQTPPTDREVAMFRQEVASLRDKMRYILPRQ